MLRWVHLVTLYIDFFRRDTPLIQDLQFLLQASTPLLEPVDLYGFSLAMHLVNTIAEQFRPRASKLLLAFEGIQKFAEMADSWMPASVNLQINFQCTGKVLSLSMDGHVSRPCLVKHRYVLPSR
jgi:hypothetical protein